MRVAVRVDAGPLIGGGHAIRCLTLADTLSRHGAEVTFVTAAMPEALARQLQASGHQLARIPAPAGLHRERGDWHLPPLDPAAQANDARETGAATGTADWLIVDHYLLDARWHSAARSFADRLLVVDDLASRPYDCDLLLDQTLGRTPSDYESCVPPATRVLAGSNYALLRPEFEVERPAALERRKGVAGVSRILVSMGTTDIGGWSARIIDEVLEEAPDCRVDVVLGAEAPSLSHVQQLAERDCRINLHVDTAEMPRLMREADLAIGAAGTTSWERCCMGLPAIALPLADNQRPSAAALVDAGAAISVERVEGIVPAVRELLHHPERLSLMSAAAFPITDGRGAERVASAIFGEDARGPATVELRPATDADIEFLWVCRNDQLTRAQSRNTEPISWKSHVRWVSDALVDPARKILIGEQGRTRVGNVGFHEVAGDTEVSIVVAPAERGIGVGRAMLNSACAEHPGSVYAAIRTGNEASRRLFETCGFAAVESSEAGFLRYVRRSEDGRRKQA